MTGRSLQRWSGYLFALPYLLLFGLFAALPLLRPVLLFVVVLNIIGSFQMFGQTFMITRGGPELSTRSLVQYIYETAFNNYRMGYAAALSWLLFLVIAVFSFAHFRLMREK